MEALRRTVELFSWIVLRLLVLTLDVADPFQGKHNILLDYTLTIKEKLGESQKIMGIFHKKYKK